MNFRYFDFKLMLFKFTGGLYAKRKSYQLFRCRIENNYSTLFIGAMFLGIIALMPYIVQGVTGVTNFRFLVGGTSLLIIVAVILDTVKQINAQLQMREYEKI